MSASSRRRCFAVLLTGAVFAAVLAVSRRPAESAPVPERWRWPEWPMLGGSPGRNRIAPLERGLPTDWDVDEKQPKNIRWSASLGSKAYGGPIVTGGRIFIGTNNDVPRDRNVQGDRGVLMCFDEKTGKFLWQIVHDKLAAGRVNDWPHEGIASTPAVEGGRLYYVSNRCEIVCADVTDGSVVWTLDMIGKLGVFPHCLATSSPLLVGDLLFVVTGNGVDAAHLNIPAPEAPSFLAVDNRTGVVKWSSNLPSIEWAKARKVNPRVPSANLVNQGLVLMHGQWSSPTYAVTDGVPQIIFPGGDGWLYAFAPATGALLWKFDGNPKGAVFALGGNGDRNHFMATPVVHEDHLYIGVGDDPEYKKSVGHLWCVDLKKAVAHGPTNQDQDVSPVNNNFDPNAAVNKNSALGWHFGGLAPQWAQRRYEFCRTLSTCAVADGLVYAADYDGFVFCLDAVTGATYWEHDTRADIWCSPLIADGKVYIGDEKAEILVFAHGKKKKLLNTVDMDGMVRNSPVAVNGVLYVVSENPTRLYAIAGR